MPGGSGPSACFPPVHVSVPSVVCVDFTFPVDIFPLTTETKVPFVYVAGGRTATAVVLELGVRPSACAEQHPQLCALLLAWTASARARAITRSILRLVNSCPRCSVQRSATPLAAVATRARAVAAGRHTPQPRQNVAVVRVRLAETQQVLGFAAVDYRVSH